MLPVFIFFVMCVCVCMQGLHVCAAITQLHGQYADAVHMYKHAVRLWEEHASVLGEENPLTLLMHYTEMLLLMKQWSDARQMAEETLQLSTSQRGMGAVTGSKARPSSMSGAHFSAEVGHTHTHTHIHVYTYAKSKQTQNTFRHPQLGTTHAEVSTGTDMGTPIQTHAHARACALAAR